MIDLGRRAVACAGWRWMPGMLVRDQEPRGEFLRLDEQSETGGIWVYDSWHYASDGERRGCSHWDQPFDGTGPAEDMVPDLTDPATLGCLRVLAREVYGDPRLHTAYAPAAGWFVVHVDSTPIGFPANGDTEAGALVAALEAADGRGEES